MRKEVTIKLDSGFEVDLEKDWVTFGNLHHSSYTAIPIEVFYQMWNSDELINFMEQYHQDRKSK